MNTRNSYKQTNKRVLNIMIFFGVIVALVVSNVLFTMITQEHFRSGKNIVAYSKDSNYVKEKIVANRGSIYDRNKEVIAQDIDAYDLVAVISENRVNASDEPAYVKDIKETSEALAPILKVEASKLEPFLSNARKKGLYQTELGSYGKTLSAQQKEDIEALKLPGIEFTKSTDRVYPVGVFASQLIGYAQYNYDDERISGVTGIEQIYDKELSGKDGLLAYLKDSDGDYLPKTKKYLETAENGKDIYLTIDKNVQSTLEKALQDTMENNSARAAWGVVMEAKTGKILAQAGYPTYDLNTREKIDNAYNTPSQISFECGSVIKPFVYAGAMEEGVYNGQALFNSKQVSVGLDANGNIVQVPVGSSNAFINVNDAMGRDYGTITYDEGLIRSTNTAMVNLLTTTYNVDTNIEYLKKFGFFEEVGIDGMGESAGELNTAYPSDKIVLGFGQGSKVTSYQLLQGYSALFGDGTMVKPYVIDKIVNPNTGKTEYKGKTQRSEQIVSKETTAQLQQLMKRIVSEPYGTAHHYAMSDVTMMAKTGTGEIGVPGGYSRSIFTSSIMAAAPADNPEIIVYYAFEGTNITTYNTSYFQDIVREGLLAVDGYGKASENNTNNSTVANFNVFEMPQLVNHSLDYAKEKLATHTSNIVLIGDGSTIISQYPNSSTKTISSQKVFLLSDGSNITMPNMSGWTRKDVLMFSKLSGINISVNGSGGVVSQSVAPNTVVSEDVKISVELK